MEAKYLLLASLCAAFLVNCHGSWVKLNSSPVCFGAKDNNYGEFTYGRNADIWSFKLVHRYGYVTCNTGGGSSWRSNWGCRPNSPEIYTFMMDRYDLHHTFPLFSERVDDTKYKLLGFTSSSSQLIFSTGSTAYHLYPSTKMEIWYGEDWHNYTEYDNGGESCIDVYGLLK